MQLAGLARPYFRVYGAPLRDASGWRTLHLSFKRRHDMAGVKEFASLFYREGALDPKTAQLVALSAMAAAGCTS